MFKRILTYFSNPSARPDYRAQEIWWCSFPEEKKERPVLVFRKFGAADSFWALPLAARSGGGTPFYFLGALRGKDRLATLAQMRVLDSRRLLRRIGRISDAQFANVNAAMARLLKETDPVNTTVRRPRVRSAPRRASAKAVPAKLVPSPFQTFPAFRFR